MTPLTHIGKGALSNLTGLKKLVCANNPRLIHIDPNALSRPGVNGTNTEVWPVIKELTLYNNNLSVISSHLLGRWDNLDLIDIRQNPWQCDCEIQWIIDEIIPLMKKTSKFKIEKLL